MLASLMRREASRNSVAVAKEHVGTVDSYDATNHAVKVSFGTELDDNGQPRISGWIPLRTQSGGANSSWVIGPTPGDQAVVSYLEGDPESGHVTGFIHNDVDKPPVVQSGEAHLKTKAATIHIDASGNVTITASGDINMATGKTVTITGATINLVGNVHLGSTGGVPAAQQGTLDTAGNADTSNLAAKVWVT